MKHHEPSQPLEPAVQGEAGIPTEHADALVVKAFRTLPHLVEVRAWDHRNGSITYEVIIDAGLPWDLVTKLVRYADRRWRRIRSAPTDPECGLIGPWTTRDAPLRPDARTLWRRP